jgi:hypothetical protein
MFLTQAEFWSQISISQSGGSRYERGREMPPQLQYLLQLAYGSDEEASELLQWLRQPAGSR